MRVRLVVQIIFEIFVNMINDYAEECGGKKHMDHCVQ